MKSRQHLAIIGSGPSSIYLLKHLLDEREVLGRTLEKISIFEKSEHLGMGMPYNPETTDLHNMANISSEEIPALQRSFSDWLKLQPRQTLEQWGIQREEISESEVYCRLSLGEYLGAQYQGIIEELKNSGMKIEENAGCEIVDIQDLPHEQKVKLVAASGDSYEVDRVVMATGHHWAGEDRPERGFYDSPWPIFKLLPEKGSYHNFAVGILGASLSAFDVVSSLAHRHGEFVHEAGRLNFRPFPGAEQFKIVLHSASGVLPHLQFDQDEPFREIYRHTDREKLLSLVDADGYLRIERYFDQVCRPALIEAFKKDRRPELVGALHNPGFGLKEFVEKMADKHDYDNPFEGMRLEMGEAARSIENHQPVHWKEVIDDLMYTLNFHAELLPAEDHLVMKSQLLPFQMNVIAAMPLPSGDIILALYDAGKIDMVAGRVSVPEEQDSEGVTTIKIESDDGESTATYRMFIDCGGQKGLGVDDYPFPSLVKQKWVTGAVAKFADFEEAKQSLDDEKEDRVVQQGDEAAFEIGGIAIDSSYRIINARGESNPRIYDIAFPHVSGIRPYSYGLQACSDTSKIVVRSWIEESESEKDVGDLEVMTEVYEML